MNNNYATGLIVFLDILGFSNFIENTKKASEIESVFEFIEKICYLYNTSNICQIRIAFFSDSFVLTTEEVTEKSFTNLMVACHLINYKLYDATKLFTRGALCHGDYYHKDNIAFGPGIIKSYREQETNAKYARLIIEHATMDILNDKIIEKEFLEKDTDGCWYYNFYLLSMDDAYIKGKFYLERAKSIMEENRAKIIERLEKYYDTPVYDKYHWLVTPFNNCCKFMSTSYGLDEFDEYLIDK